MTQGNIERGFKQLLAEANAVIETVSVQDLVYMMDDPDVLLVDVRGTSEREKEGALPGSIHAPRGLLEFHADPESPAYNADLGRDCKLVLFCGTGGRSALATKTLVDMGYTDVCSLAGGASAWIAAGNRLE